MTEISSAARPPDTTQAVDYIKTHGDGTNWQAKEVSAYYNRNKSGSTDTKLENSIAAAWNKSSNDTGSKYCSQVAFSKDGSMLFIGNHEYNANDGSFVTDVRNVPADAITGKDNNAQRAGSKLASAAGQAVGIPNEST